MKTYISLKVGSDDYLFVGKKKREEMKDMLSELDITKKYVSFEEANSEYIYILWSFLGESASWEVNTNSSLSLAKKIVDEEVIEGKISITGSISSVWLIKEKKFKIKELTALLLNTKMKYDEVVMLERDSLMQVKELIEGALELVEDKYALSCILEIEKILFK